MSELFYLERPAVGGPAAGLLVLCHGRGSDERDVMALARVLDPDRRLVVVSVRGPLKLPGWSGFHWYASEAPGHPDRSTFRRSLVLLAELHDELWERTGLGPAQTVLAGFSMGTVMSYAMSYSADRPEVTGLLALSGFMPDAAELSLELDLAGRDGTSVLISHGLQDQTVSVERAREAHQALEEAGGAPVLVEFDGAHHADATSLVAASVWLRELLPG